MTVMALEMRTISRAASTRLYKKEERDFEAKLAAWKKKQDEKAKHTVAKLPKAIKDAASARMRQLIVCVETSLPHLYSETLSAYKEFRTRWKDGRILTSGTRVSLGNSRYLPRGCKPIARWALRQKFEVHVVEWKESESHHGTTFLEVDRVDSKVVPESSLGQYPIYTGLSIVW